ncbi:hypothetical protein [Flavobacterium lipolyticum]|uniref:Uncharacterized protein n=1 Tax=Flavobacterium lipolyticum TaxID=2893754 RepID=A0ABS8LZ12_9FLAO|nr:hypothetical protein [Flavobacterium sp. F-126]MCC9017644.1 hypothetical protein [Flavobacterium sp. F-126]
MLKKILLTFLLLNNLPSFSQDIAKEFDLKLEEKRDFFQVVNEDKKEVILFLNDKEKANAIRFDEKFNIIDSLTIARPEKKYESIIGYSQKDNNCFVFWASKDRKEISSQYINFTTKKTENKPIALELKKEKIVQELTINNKFYLITIIKNTSTLKFYISDDNGNLNEKIVDLSHLEFKNIFDHPENLYTVLTDESSEPCFQTIANDSPPSLALSSKRYKIYTYNPEEIIFTIDNTTHATQVLRINLQDFTPNFKSIKQQKTTKGEYGAITFRSNSFLIDNKILQIKTNAFVLFFTISDLNGNILKEYKVLHDQEIDFKNSDFLQQKNSFFWRKNDIFSSTKPIKNSEQFLRRIKDAPSISCYNLNGIYYTAIGSSEDITQSSVGISMNQNLMSTGGMGMNGTTMIPFNSGRSYTVTNLISYKNKAVVYTNCIFDSTFNHIDREMKISAFDKARIFLEENEEIKKTVSIFSKTLYKDLILFKFKNSLYLGNYNKNNKKYQIFSFTE